MLVVDDEDMVRRIAQASLEIRGYTVVMARNGLEAIREVRKNSSIGVVLLDLTMPVMSGEDAIDEILTERPGDKVIVSTGYDHREAIARFSNKPVAGYLQKPYTSRQSGGQGEDGVEQEIGVGGGGEGRNRRSGAETESQ